MFTIKKKAKTPGIIWDESKGRPLCKFEGGVFKTNDASIAVRLKAMGYTVTGKADASVGNTTAEKVIDTAAEE